MRFPILLLLLVAITYAQLCVSQAGRLYLASGALYSIEWNNATAISGPQGVEAALEGAGWALLVPQSGGAYEAPGVVASSCINPQAVLNYAKIYNTPWGPAAPVGLAYYGVAERDGDYYPEPYLGSEVAGCFRLLNFTAVSLSPLGPTAGYSIQLNAYVKSNGHIYWAQELVRYSPSGFELLINLWNMTSSVSTLRGVRGLGSLAFYGEDLYYYYLAPLPNLTAGCMEIRASGDSLEFLLNGTLMDKVVLPEAGLQIAAEPSLNGRGLPMDLELVLGGYGGVADVALVERGSLELKLYVAVGTSLVPPPSVWSIGASTREIAIAAASPRGAEALVDKGEPQLSQLWAQPLCVYYLNGTRYCGRTEYLVSLALPNGSRLLWAPRGANLTFHLPTIRQGGLELRPEASELNLTVEGPLRLRPEYEAYFKVYVDALGSAVELWLPNGSRLTASQFYRAIGGVAYEPLYFAGGGREIAVAHPLNLTVVYTAVYRGRADDLLGLPSPLSVAVLQCGNSTTYSLAGLDGEYNATYPRVVEVCSAHLFSIPISLYLSPLALLLFTRKLFRRRNVY